MHITLLDTSTLKLQFTYNLVDVDFAKSLGGQYDKRSKSWTVSLCHLRKIIDRWPNASFEDKDATVAARLAMWRRWVRAFNNCGIWFGYAEDGKTITCNGDGVNSAFIEAVRQRSAILEQFLGDQVFPRRPITGKPLPAVEPTKGDQLVWNGIQNAKANEERQAEFAERRKFARRRDDWQQTEIGGDE